MIPFNDNVRITGNLTVVGDITGATRSSLSSDSSQKYELPFQDMRVWDDFSLPLPGPTATFTADYRWEPNGADDVFFTATRACRVIAITARVEVVGTDGGAVTAVIKKAASATDIASGTALHSGSIDLKGTVDTNQTITLTTTLADRDIAAGTSIGIDFTGTLTSARGTVTVHLALADTDDLIVTTGTFGTALPYLASGEMKARGSNTMRSRILFTLPPEYVAGQPVSVNLSAGMLTTIADTAATIDVEAYKSDRDTTIGGTDLVTTSATSINSTTFDDREFVLTSTNLEPGDILDIRITMIVNDAATGTSVVGAVAHGEMWLTVQG